MNDRDEAERPGFPVKRLVGLLREKAGGDGGPPVEVARYMLLQAACALEDAQAEAAMLREQMERMRIWCSGLGEAWTILAAQVDKAVSDFRPNAELTRGHAAQEPK